MEVIPVLNLVVAPFMCVLVNLLNHAKNWKANRVGTMMTVEKVVNAPQILRLGKQIFE